MSDVNICVLHKEEWVPLACLKESAFDVQSFRSVLDERAQLVKRYGLPHEYIAIPSFNIKSAIYEYKAQNWIRRWKARKIINMAYLCKKFKIPNQILSPAPSRSYENAIEAEERFLNNIKPIYEESGLITKDAWNKLLNRLPDNRT